MSAPSSRKPAKRFTAGWNIWKIISTRTTQMRETTYDSSDKTNQVVLESLALQPCEVGATDIVTTLLQELEVRKSCE